MNHFLPLQNQTINFDEDSDQCPPEKIKLSSIERDWCSVDTTLVLHDGGVFSNPPPRHFVLCGRGERSNRHPGNKTFRRLVDHYRTLYNSATRKQKGLLATSIVLALKNQDRKFVHYDKTSKLWKDVGMKQAIKKTSQALRELAPEKKNCTKNDKGARHDNCDETGPDEKYGRNESNNPDEVKDEMENKSVIFSSHRGQSDVTLSHPVSLDDELDISEGDEGEDSEDDDDDDDDDGDFKQEIGNFKCPLPRPALTYQFSDFPYSADFAYEGDDTMVVPC